jgi:hypothetical protein
MDKKKVPKDKGGRKKDKQLNIKAVELRRKNDLELNGIYPKEPTV